MKRACLLAVCLLAGCGTSDGTGTVDAGEPDLTTVTGGELPSSPDLALLEVPGKQLVAGSFDVQGTTDDDQGRAGAYMVALL